MPSKIKFMRNIYTKGLLIGLLTFLYCNSQAQDGNFVKGYYITLNFDTIRGYLNQTNDYELIKGVNFKKNENSSELELLKPKSIKKFVFDDGRSFESLQFSKTDQGKTDTTYLFGKIITKGICSLYDISTTRFEDDLTLAVEKNCKVYSLKHENKYFVNEYGHEVKTLIVEDYRYLGILKVLLGDCDSIKPSLTNNLKFDLNSIQYIIQKYNRIKNKNTLGEVCKPIETYTPESRKESKQMVYYNFNKILKNKYFTNNYNIGFGYSKLIYNPDKSRFFSVSCGVNFQLFDFNIDYKESYVEYKFSAQKIFIEIPIALNIHLYTKPNLKIYSIIGFIPYLSYLNKLRNGTDYLEDYQTEIVSKFTPDVKSQLNVTISGGLACIYKKFYTHINYQLNNIPSLVSISLGYVFK